MNDKPCPRGAQIAQYVQLRTRQASAGPDLDDLVDHAVTCEECAHKLAVALQWLEAFDERVRNVAAEMMATDLAAASSTRTASEGAVADQGETLAQPSLAWLAHGLRRAFGQAVVAVSAFKIAAPSALPATLAPRSAASVPPPQQVEIVMPALERGNWLADVTLEIRPTEIRALLSAKPGADRSSLAMPHAALRAKDGSLVSSAASAELEWLEDGSGRCYLIVWQAGFDEGQLGTVIDSATDDNLVVWLT